MKEQEMHIEETIKKYNITETDLKDEYQTRWDSDYLEECTLRELVDLIINEQVFAKS
jgi:hypothetical protein